MSQEPWKFIEPLPALTPVNAPLAPGDKPLEAFAKLQGQVRAARPFTLNELTSDLEVPNGVNLLWNTALGLKLGAFDLDLTAGELIEVSGAVPMAGPGSTPSTVAQTVAAATTATIVGTTVKLSPQAIQPGLLIRWKMPVSKTAAGTASRTFNLRYGTTGTPSDASIAAFVVPAGTAVVDSGVCEINWVCTASGATAAGVSVLSLIHNGSGGLSTEINPNIQGAPATFDSSTSGFAFLSLSLTTGLAEIIKIAAPVMAEILKGAN